MRYLLILVVMLALLMPTFAAAQGSPDVQVDTYGLRIDGRTVEVLFRVRDRATGRDLQGLTSRDLRLIEDNLNINPRLEVSETQTDAVNPFQSVDLATLPGGAQPVEGSQAVELEVVGSTIGIVYDASLLTNAAGDPTDYVARGRGLIIDFLEAGRTIAPNNPEHIGLFIPLSVPTVSGENIRPMELPDFVHDRNAVINTLNQIAPRTGKTNIFDTISLAVAATADAAAQRGADAYVLVVTDGGDSTSVGSLDALMAEASARNVRMLIVGVGPQQRLASNAATLTTLANKTRGAYIGNPSGEELQNFYGRYVNVVGQSAYVLRYSTDLIDDGKTHNLIIRIEGPGRGESPVIPLFVDMPGPVEELDLRPVLQGYALRAVPLLIVVSVLMTSLVWFSKRFKGPSSSISGGITRA